MGQSVKFDEFHVDTQGVYDSAQGLTQDNVNLNVQTALGQRVKYTDALTLEEIAAASDLTNKVASAQAAKSLKESLSTSITPQSVSFTPVTGVRYVTDSMFRYGNLVMGYMWIVISDTSLLARSTAIGTFSVNAVADAKPVLLKVDGNKTENCAFMINAGNTLRVDNNWGLPSTGTYRGFICYRC